MHKGGEIPAITVETSKLAENRKKMHAGEARKAEASVQTEADCAPASSRRPSRRRNGIKNARR
ncbi:MAG: hypothetical protein ACLR23_04055 [Clostridia bacterium]